MLVLHVCIQCKDVLSFGQIIFEKGGVFIHTHVSKAEDDALLPGKIVIKQKVCDSSVIYFLYCNK